MDTAPDYDYLSLQLAFYLASWGMYRGSSFLLQKDYKVHVPVVEELLKPQYDCLFGLECVKLRDAETQNKLEELQTVIKIAYTDIRKSVKEKEVLHEVSNTLITKVLMGTLGCVPAFDRFFVEGVKALKVTMGFYDIKKSLLPLVDFYVNNRSKFEDTRNKMKVYDLPYPQMKLLDMGFWQIGYETVNR